MLYPGKFGFGTRGQTSIGPPGIEGEAVVAPVAGTAGRTADYGIDVVDGEGALKERIADAQAQFVAGARSGLGLLPQDQQAQQRDAHVFGAGVQPQKLWRAACRVHPVEGGAQECAGAAGDVEDGGGGADEIQHQADDRHGRIGEAGRASGCHVLRVKVLQNSDTVLLVAQRARDLEDLSVRW